jgi:thiamine pyrophosphokinase
LKTIIFANGKLNHRAQVLQLIQAGDVILAADGGALHCRKLGIYPHTIIGDFDSLTEEDLQEMQAHGTKVLRYPTRKDFTDLELALEYACSLSSNPILILGGLGQRWDQTLANILLLADPVHAQNRISLIDGNQEILLVRGEQTLEIVGKPGDTVSLIPVGGHAAGVTTQNLEYPLSDETLFLGAARGVSNVLLAKKATIHLQNGLLICTVIRKERRM